MFTRGSSTSNPLLVADGFDRLYARHSQPILIFLARRVLDPEVALDLTAESFAQAFVSRRRFRGKTDAEAEAWLYAIARHELSRYLRRGRAEGRALAKLGVEVTALSETEHARVEELADLAELRKSVVAGLNEISEDQRAALELRVIRELPYPQVALELGVSEEAARARVSRGLKALARVLEAPPQAKESVS